MTRKTVKTPEKPAAPKGYRPGTPGVLTDDLPAGVVFGARNKRLSPYDALLKSLAAGEGRYLRFASPQARSAITSRARILGIRVWFAEHDGILWVSLAKRPAKALDGETLKEADKSDLPGLALRAIAAKRQTAGEIISWMRSRGHTNGMGLTETETLLREMCKSGKIKLQALKRSEDPDRPDRWMLA